MLRLADLTEEEERLHGRINQYERKVDSLLSEVSSLKNEVSHIRKPPHCHIFWEMLLYNPSTYFIRLFLLLPQCYLSM